MSFTSVPPTAITATVSRSGIPRAGMIYSLTCSVTKIRGLINSPNATWTIGGVAIMSENVITTSVVSTGTAAFSTLTFDPLRISHGGILFECCGSLISPALEKPLTSSTFETVVVQSMS